MTRLLVSVGAAGLLVLGFAAGSLVHVSLNSLWIPVVAALGASLLTGIFGFGGEALRDRRSGALDAERRRREAYIEFLIAANGQIAMVSTIRELRKMGTGLKPAVTIDDPVAFLQQFNRESIVLFAAWTRVWLHGSQVAITISNRFVDAVIPAAGAATAQGKARPLVLSRLLGEAWTKEQEKEQETLYGTSASSASSSPRLRAPSCARPTWRCSPVYLRQTRPRVRLRPAR